MIRNIQILRAFAAIIVVVFHIAGTASSYSQAAPVFHFFSSWGASGVDIFFVISGFVMLYTQMLKRKTPMQFFRGRVLRIVPIYWVITLLLIALFYLHPTLFREMVVTPLWAVSSLFFMSAVFTGGPPVVRVGWTLEWEMLFYLVFAVGLLFKSWRLLGVFVGVTLALVAVLTESWIVFEFFLGMGAAYLYHRKVLSRSVGLALFLVGFAALALTLIPAVYALEVDRLFIWGVPSFFIVLGVLYAPQIKSPVLSYLGDASYSIYLFQILSIPAFYKLSSSVLAGWNGDVLALACLVFSVSFGCAAYSFIEKPVTIRLKRYA